MNRDSGLRACLLVALLAAALPALAQPTFQHTDLHEASRRQATLSFELGRLLRPMLARDGDHFGFVADAHYDRVSDLPSTLDGAPALLALDRAFAGVGGLVQLGARDRYVGAYLGGFAYGASRPLVFVVPIDRESFVRNASEPVGQQFIDDAYGLLGRWGDVRARVGYAMSRVLSASPRVLSDDFPSTTTQHALDLSAAWRGIEVMAQVGLDPGEIQVGWLSGDLTELTWLVFDVDARGRSALVLPQISARVGLERYGSTLTGAERGEDVFIGWHYRQPLLGLLPNRFIRPPKGLSALSLETQGSVAVGRPALRDAQLQGTVGIWMKYVRLEATGGVSYFSDPSLTAPVAGTLLRGGLGLGMDTLDYLEPPRKGDWIFELFATVTWRESWAEDLVRVVDFAGKPTLEFRLALITRL